jgi:hypothetical protein
MPTPITTVTPMPPGFTVSLLSTEARPLTDKATVALWPAASVPADGETVSSPIRLEGSVTDHVTGPPDAVTVRLPPSSGLSTIVVGVTLSVPCLGGGGGGGGVGAAVAVLVAVLVAVALLVGGAGEPGAVPRPDEGAVADGEGPAGVGGEPPAAGEGEPSAVGAGDRWTALLAGTVRCPGAPGPLGWAPGVLPDVAPDVAPALPPGTAPCPRAPGRP